MPFATDVCVSLHFLSLSDPFLVHSSFRVEREDGEEEGMGAQRALEDVGTRQRGARVG